MIYGAPVDLVISGITLKCPEGFYLNRGTLGFYGTATYELVEIYNYTLSAQEVTNLYNNSRLRDVNFNKTEQLGPELVVNGGFDTDTDWTKQASWTIHDGKAYYDGLAGQYIIPVVNLPVTAGKRYKVTFTISGAATTGRMSFSSTSYTSVFDYLTIASPLSLSNGTYTYTVLCVTSSPSIRIYGWTAIPYQLDNLSIKEILVESTKPILDVCCGVNKLSGDIYGDEKLINGDFSDGLTGWSYTVGAGGIVEVVDGVLHMLETTSNVNIRPLTAPLTVGKLYRCLYKCDSIISGSAAFFDGVSVTYHNLSVGIKSFDFTAITTNIFILTGTSSEINIDYISIKEVIPSVINTAVTIVKDGDRNVMKLLTTSKIDCGSYHTLTGDISGVIWFKNFIDTGYYQSLFGNGKLYVLLNRTAARLQIQSDAATNAYTTNGSTPFSNKNWTMFAFTRTSIGITNLYINGVLSGTANQSSGTPVAGTGNITVGTYSGYLNNVTYDKARLISGILTPAEISQIFTAERQKYNV